MRSAAPTSPWRENWHELAQEWHEVNKEQNPEKLKAFINLRLGETWEEDGDALEAHALRPRCEKYPEDADVPNGVGLLTASVDVQSSGRLECVVKGWGAKEESWLIAYQQFFGDPGREEVWTELDEFLLTKFRHQSGREIGISATFIDSGGHNTDDVYRFVKGRQSRKVFAFRGASESGKEILSEVFAQQSASREAFHDRHGYSERPDLCADEDTGSGTGIHALPDWDRRRVSRTAHVREGRPASQERPRSSAGVHQDEGPERGAGPRSLFSCSSIRAR